jgi:hypothetical protein
MKYNKTYKYINTQYVTIYKNVTSDNLVLQTLYLEVNFEIAQHCCGFFFFGLRNSLDT